MKPAFSWRPLEGFSVCEIISFVPPDEQLQSILRRISGVGFPVPGGAFVAGTRSVLRPDDTSRVFLLTEGESEGVLYRRLLKALPPAIGSIFDVSHGLVGRRLENPRAEALPGLFTDHDPGDLPEGGVRMLPCDRVPMLLHRPEKYRWHCYIPRSQAEAFDRFFMRAANNYLAEA